jgi:ABC-2 type transport system ATP-binding protein
MSSLAIDIQNLTKRYGDKTAVDNISFQVKPGEFFGFLGPNGAGKSTTIKCITGIATYKIGRISLYGIDAKTHYREARSLVGLSPQEFNVDIFERTWKILDFVGGYFGLPKAARRARIEELLATFSLEEHRDKKFRELSGGLKRRLVLARALMHDPEILILDEPTAGVDVEQRHELWEHLQKLNAAGKTILLTSHYLEEVELLCSRVAIINGGRIVADKCKEEYLKNGQTLEKEYLSITHGDTW